MRSALLVVLTAFLAACGAPVTPSPTIGATPTPTAGFTPAPAAALARICYETSQDIEPAVPCTRVIGEVLLAIGPDMSLVRAAWFRLGLPCPPNARCIAPPPGSGYVLVRIEGAGVQIYPVTVSGGDISVEAPTGATFDIWPPSGEQIPAPDAPDFGEGAPAEVAGRAPLPFCGDERDGADSRARRCFLAAVLDSRPAEFVTRITGEGGKAAVVVYRYEGRGPVLEYAGGTPESPGPWLRNDCAIGPAGDDEVVFVVRECLLTAIF